MDEKLKQSLQADIKVFEEKVKEFEAGEIDRKDYKRISGGFGSYAQRTGGYMLRLPMTGGRLGKEKLKFLAESVKKHGIDLIKMTTCQTIQFHNLSADTVITLMKEALEAGIVTRGAGGDFPRNVMASPLSGVEQGEYFDVLPWAELIGNYLEIRMLEINLPRKLKVAFSNSEKNSTHATFRDLGFTARKDGTFDVYCAGGLGPGPELGIRVAEAIPPENVLACVDGMIQIFTRFGNYENRVWSRSRFLRKSLGEEGIRREFAEALEETLKTSAKVSPKNSGIHKEPHGEIEGERVIPQKQQGLYAVSYHPPGGILPAEKPGKLNELMKDMKETECRLSPDGTLYIINLTAPEVPAVLEVTSDGAVTPFAQSVCCIGAAICQHGIRDSQGLLSAMRRAVEKESLPPNALPRVHVSGCPSGCGTHQVGTIGFQGGVKRVGEKLEPAFLCFLGGREHQGEERMGEQLGFMLQEKIPEFMVKLGRTVAGSGTDFDTWLKSNGESFRELAGEFVVK